MPVLPKSVHLALRAWEACRFIADRPSQIGGKFSEEVSENIKVGGYTFLDFASNKEKRSEIGRKTKECPKNCLFLAKRNFGPRDLKHVSYDAQSCSGVR